MEQPESNTPGLLAMAKNLSETAMATVANFVENGNILVEDSVRLHRESTCASCQHYLVELNRCNLCGCFMEAKTKLIVAKCPIGKW